VSIRVAREFQHRWSCFFATSYTLELELFDNFLFRRLGERPLNVTVLCDFNRLAHRLADIPAEDARLLQRANRDYLLRGVALARSFHPKTYFFGNEKEGVLLVGSGNLSLRGIEEGHEVFARFTSTQPEGLATLRGWRDWVEALVERIDDLPLRKHWLDVKERTHEWLPGSSEESRFLSNLERSFLDQFSERLSRAPDELHVTAPFYDRDANALQRLLERVAPKQLYLYLGGGTSVAGGKLASVLEAFPRDVQLLSYEPNEFVHAKLVGAVTGEHALLLSGSPNLSLAAFTASLAEDSYANIEAAVIAEPPAELLRRVFLPPGFSLTPLTLAAVNELEYRDDAPAVALPFRLLSARPTKDAVEVAYSGQATGEIYLTGGLDPRLIVGETTTGPLVLPEGGALVWLCDVLGAQLSNKVVLDDPVALSAWLEEHERREGPAGLDPPAFNEPIGALLLRLHQECIFDIDETPAAERARRLAQEEGGDTVSWDFLEELAKEELRLDPRLDRYPRSSTAWVSDEDDLIGLLKLMLGRTPVERHLKPVAPPPSPPGGGTGVKWTPEQKLQVRVNNVLQRWCGALIDPRFTWIDRYAPVRNYSALLLGLAECWEQEFLSRERLTRLLETLFTGFVASERAPGYLLGLADEDRAEALSRLPREARLIGGALCYCLLSTEADWREIVFGLQPFLKSALGVGVIAVGEETPALVRRLVGEQRSSAAINERLGFASTYTDNPHWCQQQERELRFARVRLSEERGAPKYAIRLEVEGATIADTALVSLVRQALDYRKARGVAIKLPDARLSVCLGDPVYAIAHGNNYASSEPLDAGRLLKLERRGIGFDRILNVEAAVPA
jgi:hypothetical protein